MKQLELLRAEMDSRDYKDYTYASDSLFYDAFKKHYDDKPIIAKAKALAAALSEHEKFIYNNDLIVGSTVGVYKKDINETELRRAAEIRNSYGRNWFLTNSDHFAPDYNYVLKKGVGGIIEDIKASLRKYEGDRKKTDFLNAAYITMHGLSEMIYGYGTAAEQKGFYDIAQICKKISKQPPSTFREALQLVWLVHISFQYEDKLAMALGRVDQYLYPFYKNDTISDEEACELLACTFLKIDERRRYTLMWDVINICIGGVDREGRCAVNELSYLILEAVKQCGICGPNLSARMTSDAPNEFWDKCLEVIGTGIGYPAIMNDEVNVKSLQKYGYSTEDCRDYCMVGCIENFLPGKQPPWSDGRFSSPKYLEFALNNGKCMQTDAQLAPQTGAAENIQSMEELLRVYREQLEFAASEYVALFKNENGRYNPEQYSQPYLSCFCPECIERGLDVMDGGTLYPSVHAAGCMGIGTVADSLSAIEQVVFNEKYVTLAQLRDALIADFEGYDALRKKLLDAPKYGNNLAEADKYAKWYVDVHREIFEKFRTRDGGKFYIGIASNTANIPDGYNTAATADGRKNREAISDAASPMHGMDKNGLTSVINSITVPDYTKSACGTVVNIKLSPNMLRNKEKRDKLRELIKIYMKKGGQEIQINCVSREVLTDAMDNPDDYSDLVVRVSGFSAFYTLLDKEVQKDILERTENE